MGRGARRDVVRDSADADRVATDGDAVDQLNRAVEARGGGAGEVSVGALRGSALMSQAVVDAPTGHRFIHTVQRPRMPTRRRVCPLPPTRR